jgi:phosphoribosyl 1,2-cyclic phosphate phosphodiesterase
MGGWRRAEARALSLDLSGTMNGRRRLVVLGSGTSSGVPMIGCDCAVCSSDDPKNKRTRCSVLVELPGGNLLIDTSPEMRLQLVRERVKMVHAIAFTHQHADHLFGLDDARIFAYKLNGPVPIFCESETEETIRSVFHYVFNGDEFQALLPEDGTARRRR